MATTGAAWNTTAADDGRHDRNTIADLNVADVFSNFDDASGKFVTQDLWVRNTRQRVGLGWRNNRTNDILVKIGAADTAEERLYNDFVGKWSAGLSNFLNPNIFLAVKTGC